METKTSKWVIDPSHSEFTFKVKHMMISTVSGHFDTFFAEAETSGDDFTQAKVKVEVAVDSINTKNSDRDAHLKSNDFFNAVDFPHIRFESGAFDGETLKGDLNIRDITLPISLDVEFNGIVTDPYGQTKAGFELSGEINRKDYGLTWNAVTEAGHIVVSDKVKLAISVQFVKQA